MKKASKQERRTSKGVFGAFEFRIWNLFRISRFGFRISPKGPFRISPPGLAVLWLWLAAGSGPAFALDPRKAVTQYVHTVWQVEQGLPANSVNAIAQTPDGYLWLGTHEGLARFDGARFTAFDAGNTQGIRSNYILALLVDRAGTLWIGAYNGGLTRFKNGTFAAYTPADGLPGNTVSAICDDGAGGLWVGTDGGGLSHFQDGKFTTYTTKAGLLSDEITALSVDRLGTLWIGAGAGLNQWTGGRFSAYTTKEGLASNKITSIHEDRQGRLWIGTQGGLNRIEGGRITTHAFRRQPADSVNTISEDRDGNLWVGTFGGGLFRLKDGEVAGLTTKDGLPHDNITAIFEDHESNLWIGTYGGGVSRLKDEKCTVFGLKEGLSNDVATTVYEDRAGNVWIGTDEGLNQLKDGNVTIYTTKNGMSHNGVWSVLEDREGNVWVGTHGHLNRLKDGRFTVFTERDGFRQAVYAMCQDREGSVWFGTGGGGLVRWKDGAFTTYSTTDGLTHTVVLALHQDRAGNLWIGTAGGGLNRWRDGRFTAITTKDGLSSDIVKCIYEDAEGVLWVSTYGGGLNRLKDGKITTYTTVEGLFDNNIHQILEDGRGFLWMSCNKGIFRVSKQELNDVAGGATRSLTCVSYGTADGMRSRVCNGGDQPAGWKTRDGRLWFPTIKGVVVIDPANIKTNRLAPPVIIERVVVENAPVELGRRPAFSPGTKRFEFHYTGLSLTAPEKVRFKYRLEGSDPEWIDAGADRVARYTNLPPGAFRFRVMACNNDGLWNEAGASFEFDLQPYFYQTKFFYALGALAVALLGWALYLWRVKHLLRRTQELEAKVAARTIELVHQKDQLLQANVKLQEAKETTAALQAAVARAGETSPGPAPDGAIDWSTLGKLRRLQAEGEPDIVQEVVELFLQEAPGRLAGLRDAAAQGDAEKLERLAHNLKGSCGSIGAHPMARACAELEAKGRSKTLDDVDALIEQVHLEFDRVQQALAAITSTERAVLMETPQCRTRLQ
jgi:ligand-binding sensor domain-containing protein/HPt (histidine-containing phosphotransfer) domain-containing protein